MATEFLKNALFNVPKMTSLFRKIPARIEHDPKSIKDIFYSIYNQLSDKGMSHLIFKDKYEKNKQLMNAACYGLIQDMKVALDEGADIHCAEDYALVITCSEGYTQAVQFLINHGANVTARNGEPLFVAIKFNRESIVELLLQHGALCTDYLLSIAVRIGNPIIVNLLLAQKKATLSRDDILYTTFQNNDDLQKIFVDYGADPIDTDMMYWAIQRKNIDLFKYFIEKGVTLNRVHKKLALDTWVQANDLLMVKFLFEKAGVTADICSFYLLYFVVSMGTLDMFQLLVSYGVLYFISFNEKDELLYIAFQDGYNSIAFLLMEYGANFFQKKGILFTELLRNGDLKTLKMIVEK